MEVTKLAKCPQVMEVGIIIQEDMDSINGIVIEKSTDSCAEAQMTATGWIANFTVKITNLTSVQAEHGLEVISPAL